MKRLLLIRHAKSSWATIGQSDFERPLNDRGIKDATEMAQKLLIQNVPIDTFITSTAKRAFTTCKAFADAYENSEIVPVNELYHAPPPIFYEVIKELKDDINNVAIFAHNPGISELASTITGKPSWIDMPTCAVYAIQADVLYWKDFKKAEKTFLFYKYPKEI